MQFWSDVIFRFKLEECSFSVSESLIIATSVLWTSLEFVWAQQEMESASPVTVA